MLHEIYRSMDNAAEQINDNFQKVKTTEWTPANVLNGTVPTNFELKYRKIGEDTLQIYGRVDTTDQTDASVFRLPEGHRPKHNTLISVPTTTDDGIIAAHFYIYTDGRVNNNSSNIDRGVHTFTHTIPLGN